MLSCFKASLFALPLKAFQAAIAVCGIWTESLLNSHLLISAGSFFFLQSSVKTIVLKLLARC